MDLKNPNKKKKGRKAEMKEKKVMEVIEKDINSFSELVLILAIAQASNTINELIKVIIEDNFNKKEETEREIN